MIDSKDTMSTSGGRRLRWKGFAARVGVLLLLANLSALAMLSIARDRSGQATAAEVAPISVTPAAGRGPISLRDRLIVGLQARLNSEVAFVDRVVMRVQTGQMPQRLVDETFFWARQKSWSPTQGRRRRPILFFQPAMRARAERIGVDF